MRNFTDMLQFSVTNNITNKVFNTASDSLARMIAPIKSTLLDYVDKNICHHFAISGHYDSYISKSCVSVLETKYLSKKYGCTLMDVDPSFALCTASVERVKKKVSCFPELVNKTIAPGVYSLVMDEDGTRMIVIKEPILQKDDRSANGILSNTSHFSTSLFFIGKNKTKWFKKVRKEIDDLVSSISKTNQENNKIRYTAMSSNGDEQKDLKVRPMKLLTFPAKESLLNEISEFKNKEKLYAEYAVPYRKGMLLAGVPGTGKTAFAFSLPQHFEMDCVSVNLDVFDKVDGDNKFNMPNTVYVIDEIDSQLVNRAEMEAGEVEKSLKTSRRLLQLLKAMDSMDGGSIVIATTNYPEKLDPALLRSGRFDIVVNMSDLSESDAIEMIKNRGCDPNVILKDESFPINPARLEQMIIKNILETNDMIGKEVASYESLGLNEEELKLETPEEGNNGASSLGMQVDDPDDE